MSNNPLLDQELLEIEAQIMENIDIDFIEKKSSEIEIFDEDIAKTALSMALQVRKLEKTLEKSRVELTKPHVDYQRSINKIVKDLKEKLKSIENSLQIKIESWIRVENENPFLRVDELTVDDGTMFKTKSWTFEIDVIEAIPTKFLMPNEKAIQEAIDNGIREIPGVHIFKDEKFIMRTKN